MKGRLDPRMPKAEPLPPDESGRTAPPMRHSCQSFGLPQ